MNPSWVGNDNPSFGRHPRGGEHGDQKSKVKGGQAPIGDKYNE